MALSVGTLKQILRGKSSAQIAAIQADAEQVALGCVASISALSQTTTFSTEDAGTVLEAINQYRDECASGGPRRNTMAVQLRMWDQTLMGA